LWNLCHDSRPDPLTTATTLAEVLSIETVLTTVFDLLIKRCRTIKLSDRRRLRASAEANDVVKPVTHKRNAERRFAAALWLACMFLSNVLLNPCASDRVAVSDIEINICDR